MLGYHSVSANDDDLVFFSVCEFHPLTLDNPITRRLHNNLWMRENSLGTEETSTIISNNRHILSSSLGHTTQVNLILSVFAIFFMHNFEGHYYKYTLLFSIGVHLASFELTSDFLDFFQITAHKGGNHPRYLDIFSDLLLLG